MSYIGRQLNNLSDRVKLDSITASATATYNLLLNSVAYVPSSAESLTVSLNGVIQAPQSSYTVSGSQITFASALTSSDSIDFILAERSITLQTPSAGSVGTSQLASSAVTTAKINADAVDGTKIADDSISDEHLDITAITGQTAITSLADTDKFLVSDASDSGNLKYVEKQYLPSSALVSLASSDSGSDVANVVFDNVFSDTYSRYIIYIDNIFNANGGEVLRYKFRKSDGSGGYEDETRTGYTYTVRFIKHSNTEENTSADSGGAQTYGNLTTGIQNSTGEHGLKAIINVYRPSTRQSSQATMTYVTCNGTYRAYSGDSTMAGILSSASNNYHTDAFLGIKLYFSAGNVDDHKIRVYGVIT